MSNDGRETEKPLIAINGGKGQIGAVDCDQWQEKVLLVSLIGINGFG